MEIASRQDSLSKARSYALLLLKFRPRSEQELRQRLIQKGFSQETAEAIIAEFKKRDLVNDEKFSRLFVTGRLLSKPMGRGALLAKLKSKGVDASLAATTVQEALKDSDELEVARELARSRLSHLKGLEKLTLRRRLYGFLSRRGFSSEVSTKVVREFLKKSPDEE